MIPALTLEPLSWDDLPEAAVLWADPAVIRWTNIAAPCTEAGAADRLEHLLDCQRGLPFSTVFALREGTAFRGLAGCPPVDTAAGIYGLFYQLLPRTVPPVDSGGVFLPLSGGISVCAVTQ